jgi:hypothetical protein
MFLVMHGKPVKPEVLIGIQFVIMGRIVKAYWVSDFAKSVCQMAMLMWKNNSIVVVTDYLIKSYIIRKIF